MATPAERHALILIGVVALLGGGIRLWRAYPRLHPGLAPHDLADDPSGVAGEDRQGTVLHTYGHSTHHFTPKSRQNGPSGKTKLSDSTSIIDLDQATVAQIESLGVLRPGVARLIVADRDDLGPFGSMREVERVPYLSWSDLRRLAPRVTFSLLPRPRNAVMAGRVDSVPLRRKRSP